MSYGPPNPIVAVWVKADSGRKRWRDGAPIFFDPYRIPILDEEDYERIIADVNADPTTVLVKVERQYGEDS